MTPATLRTLPASGLRPAVAAAGLETLRRREAELEAEWQQLQAAGYGASGLRSLLTDASRSGPERARILGAADRAQEAFLDGLDEFQRRTHAYFMDQVERELEHAMTMMAEFYGRRRLRSVRRAHRRLAHLAERYRQLEPLYGTPRDHRRIAVYQRFYAGVVAFSQRIRRLDPTLPASPASPGARLARLGRALAWRLRRVPAVLRLLGAGLRLLSCVLARQGAARGTPFTRRVDDLFRAWGAVKGYQVRVEGREHAATPARASVVTLFAPAHRHGVTDNVTAAHLALPDYLVFSAVGQLPGVPRFLKDRVAATPGLIAVGDGHGRSVDRALEALAEGVSRNILIYPEGSVSEGFRGTRPPRANFGASLVPRIREAGHELRIVPVTYPDNARFLDLPPRSAAAAERRLRVVVSPPFETPMLDAILAAGGGAMLNRVLRLAWLENLTTDAERLLGHDRVAAIEARLDVELDGIRYWGSLEPVPAPDKLAIQGGGQIRVYDEPFRGKRVRVLEIPRSARNARDCIVLPDLQAPDSRELLIGIRAPSHLYLAVGGVRFDGDIFRPLRVRARDYVYPGILIRLVGVPVKSVHAIRRKLDELSGREYRTLTCANSACQLIARAANIEIDDHADMRPFLPSHVLPTRTIRKLIERGVRRHDGTPVDYQIYKTDERSLEAILRECRRQEIRILRAHLEAASVGAWRLVRRWLARGSGRRS